MEVFRRNLEALIVNEGKDIKAFLSDYGVQRIEQLSLQDIDHIAGTFGLSFENLLCYPHHSLSGDWPDIKLLILDVDGVMTDGGMYFTENGDQIKKYNTKDGMAIMKLRDTSVKTGIISSGFKTRLVKDRADLLKIDLFYVGRDRKIDILHRWCSDLSITMSEVAMIGDDINDLDIIQSIGFSACPADAVDIIKKNVDIVLHKKGGEGCVREFIDRFILSR